MRPSASRRTFAALRTRRLAFNAETVAVTNAESSRAEAAGGDVGAHRLWRHLRPDARDGHVAAHDATGPVGALGRRLEHEPAVEFARLRHSDTTRYGATSAATVAGSEASDMAPVTTRPRFSYQCATRSRMAWRSGSGTSALVSP